MSTATPDGSRVLEIVVIDRDVPGAPDQILLHVHASDLDGDRAIREMVPPDFRVIDVFEDDPGRCGAAGGDEDGVVLDAHSDRVRDADGGHAVVVDRVAAHVQIGGGEVSMCRSVDPDRPGRVLVQTIIRQKNVRGAGRDLDADRIRPGGRHFRLRDPGVRDRDAPGPFVDPHSGSDAAGDARAIESHVVSADPFDETPACGESPSRNVSRAIRQCALRTTRAGASAPGSTIVFGPKRT